jgi:hypothetical protein
MNQAIEDFCVRFAAGAGTLFVWGLDGCNRLVAPVCEPFSEDRYMPTALHPLTAQLTIELGTWAGGSDEWTAAAHACFGLTRAQQDLLLSAADGVPWNLTEAQWSLIWPLRDRLLRITGARKPA